ncbi:hypothetical protein QQ008_13635 [Fulvivirgaceae bacterium BMA10]|uniref:CarboxypepD_reg-like domain-containing protein n=1 Tax=Splendidivirga corallicola TaxID=3051826 RepID=A0ABT8KPT9_9BACT|nr:hypothetical protein [Fulvivirgaceae bacterium BMA10]
MVAKRISFIFFVLLFISQGALLAQSNILKKKLTFKINNERFEDVLLLLAEEGGFSFSYNPALLPVDSLMSLNVENSSVRTVLTSLLGEEMELRVNGNLLVILKTKYLTNATKSLSAKKNYTVDGYLQNSETGEFVGNAIVYDVGGLRSTTTNSQGYFSLEIPVKQEVIAITIGGREFEEKAVVLLNKDQKLNIPVIPSKGAMTSSRGGSLEGTRRINEMKVVQLLSSEKGLAQSQNLNLENYRFAQASFLPFLGTNLKMSGSVENKLSLNVLAGYNGATSGLELGGMLNINRFYSKGAQIAGIGNIIGTETNGVQLAGIFNTNFGTVRGVQMAGINNLVLDSLKGVQVSGINNIITGRTDGVQISGINNLAKNNVDGIQIAGISNIAIRDVNKLQLAGIINFGYDITGVQIAGIVNGSYGQVKGFQVGGILNTSRTVQTLQLAGVMNFAADTVYGAQLSGVVNFARHNKGFQLGLINIGDTASGTSIGVLNLFLRGYNKLEIFGTEILPLSARVKFGNRKFYNTIGFGTQGFGSNNVWGYSYGIGKVIRVGKKQNDLNFDLSVTDLQDDDTWIEQLNLNARFGMHYGFSINRRFMIYGGPVWNHLIYDIDDLPENQFLEDLAPYKLYETTVGDKTVQSWIGFEFGIRVL